MYSYCFFTLIPFFFSGLKNDQYTDRANRQVRMNCRRETRDTREKRRHAAFLVWVIFTRAHVSLALLSLRKNGDYS